MEIIQVELPGDSLLQDDNKQYDYTDSFQTIYLDRDNKISTTDLAKAFMTSAPSWTAKLFELRNRVVSVFGLKTSDGSTISREERLKNFKGEPGESLGLFKVYAKTRHEVILGEDDKHLNFRVSLMKEDNEEGEKKLTISTVVEFNNVFGKLYFLPVKPFHKLIVPRMLRGVANKLEDK